MKLFSLFIIIFWIESGYVELYFTEQFYSYDETGLRQFQFSLQSKKNKRPANIRIEKSKTHLTQDQNSISEVKGKSERA